MSNKIKKINCVAEIEAIVSILIDEAHEKKLKLTRVQRDLITRILVFIYCNGLPEPKMHTAEALPTSAGSIVLSWHKPNYASKKFSIIIYHEFYHYKFEGEEIEDTYSGSGSLKYFRLYEVERGLTALSSIGDRETNIKNN